jgi:hypothetical protein
VLRPATAVAAFASADAAGTWRFYAIDVGGAADGGGRWHYGTLVFDVSGNFMPGSSSIVEPPFSGALDDSNTVRLPTTGTITGGAFVLTATGQFSTSSPVTGTLPIDDCNAPVCGTEIGSRDLQGKMLEDKKTVVGVATTTWSVSGGPFSTESGITYGLFIAIKVDGTAFAQTDIQSIIGAHQIIGFGLAEDIDGSTGGFSGTATVDNIGSVTAISLATNPNGTFSLDAGLNTLTVSPVGTVTGQIDTINGLGEQHQTNVVQAQLLADKSAAFGVATTRWSDGVNFGANFELGAVIKNQSAIYSQVDLTSTWRWYELRAFSNAILSGLWGSGTVVFNAIGTLSGGSVQSSTGALVAFNSGSATLGATGTLSGSLTRNTSETVTFNGQMLPGLSGALKSLIVAKATSSPSGDESFVLLVRELAAAPPGSLAVVKAGTGSGTVQSANPAEINCGSDCSEPYPSGTVVSLTATALTGATFTGWSNAAATCGVSPANCMVTVSGATTATATFTLNTYTLSLVKAGTGTGAVTSTNVDPACTSPCSGGPFPATIPHGTTVTLTATPDSSSTVTWTGCDSTSSGGTQCLVTVTAARGVTATFTRKTYTLTVTIRGSGLGVATGQGAGTFAHGTAPHLVASANTGSQFRSWSGCDTTATTACDLLTMTSNRAVTVTFSKTFTDTSLGGVVIKLVHLSDLRAAINNMRQNAGLSAIDWTTDPDASLGANLITIKRLHLIELRNALDATKGAQTYAEALVAGATLVRAAHFTELRAKILALE